MSKRVRTVAAELEAKTGKLSADMRRAERIVGKSTRQMQRDMSRVESPAARMGGGAVARGSRYRRATGMLSGMGATLKGAAVMGGVYGIGTEIKKAKQFEEVLVDIAVRGSRNKQWMDATRASMIALSNEYGIGKEQLADYVGTIIDQTGNTELAISTLRSMTAVAFSANVPMKELAGTVVEMQSKLALAPKDFETALGILAAQADKGKVPLNQMSKFLPEVLNATTQFGHRGIAALRDYGAVLQMSARGAGSLAEANTAMNRMLDRIAAKRGKIEKTLGIKLKKGGAWLQLGDMLKEIVGGLIRMKREGKDVEKYITTTFGIRGKKAILPMLQQGMAGWGSRVGAAGGKGGLTSFDALVGAGGAGTIQERVARKRQLSPELDQWNKSVERLKNKIHMHLLPAIKKLGDIIPQVSSALGWMIDNWKILLALWAGAKMARFFLGLRSLAMGRGGGGGKGGALEWVLGGLGFGGGSKAVGGVTAGGGGTTTATAGASAGFVSGLASATVGLVGLTAALAPAVAGLHELGKAYTKEGKKEKLKQLREKAAAEKPLSRIFADALAAATGVGRGLLEKEGLAEPLSLEGGRGMTWGKKREIATRQQLGLSRSQSATMQQAYMDWLDKKSGKAELAVGQLGPEKVKQLAGASDYQLKQVGLNREIVNTLSALATVIQKDSRMTTDELRTFVAMFKRGITVNVTDPNRTPTGVTNGRRGTQ